ncbi:MAG: MaoC family dehydratase [Pseudomonadales bacterium]|nr:MaoC family dehydratase [Pseudomonadales bacterium]
MSATEKSAIENAMAILAGRINQPQPPGDWTVMTQEMVDKFADATGDHQWIHVDVERASKGPFGGPIAHGQLTLSILGQLSRRATPDEATEARIPDQKMGINYGFNKVRFPSPVPVGARIRARRVLKTAEIKGGMIETMTEVTVEIEGQEKPACVAESLSRMVF